MSVRIVAVGRLKGPEAELFARYAGRLTPRPGVVEIADGAGSPAEAQLRECAALLAAVHAGDFVVALDLGGLAVDTDGLAAALGTWRMSGRKPCFVVGGAAGLNAAVLARADATLSLGRLTWPHMLARVMLVEQLYRVQSIAAGHPYHRRGRPA